MQKIHIHMWYTKPTVSHVRCQAQVSQKRDPEKKIHTQYPMIHDIQYPRHTQETHPQKAAHLPTAK